MFRNIKGQVHGIETFLWPPTLQEANCDTRVKGTVKEPMIVSSGGSSSGNKMTTFDNKQLETYQGRF